MRVLVKQTGGRLRAGLQRASAPKAVGPQSDVLRAVWQPTNTLWWTILIIAVLIVAAWPRPTTVNAHDLQTRMYDEPYDRGGGRGFVCS